MGISSNKLVRLLQSTMVLHHYAHPSCMLSLLAESVNFASMNNSQYMYIKTIITFTTAFIARCLHLLHHSRTNRTNGHLDATPFTPWTSPNSSSFSTSPAKNVILFLFITGPSRKYSLSQVHVMYCNKTCYIQTDSFYKIDTCSPIPRYSQLEHKVIGLIRDIYKHTCIL